MKTPEDYLPQEGTLAYQIARENAVKDMAKWDCNRARNLVTKYPPESPVPHLTFEDAIKICTVSPQELDAIVKMEKDLMAKLERANKIDRLKAELRLKAEELRASEEEQAFRDSPNEPLTNEELDVMLDRMNRDYMAARQAEEGTEARTYPTKPSPHDE